MASTVTPAALDALVAKLLPCSWTDSKIAGVTCAEPLCYCQRRPAVRAALVKTWNEAVEAAKDTFNYPQAYERLCALRIPEET